jgi:hypothetical protein
MATIRTGQSAVDFAQGQVTRPTPPPGVDDWFNRCLIFVRTCFRVAALAPNAESGYKQAQFKHGTGGTPPLGVPVWWTNGGDGHVAISTGDGNCYSTDIKRHGGIDKVAISFITRKWGADYRGWTEDVNGVRIYRPNSSPLPAVDLGNVREAARRDQFRPAGSGLHESDILIVEKALRALNLRDPRFVDGYAGTEFRTAYAKWQKRTVPAPFDGIPGKESLTKLGQAHGFRVVD